MKIVQDGDDWMLVNSDGIEVARRSSREEVEAHHNRLSAYAKRPDSDEHDEDRPIERRQTMTRAQISSFARAGAWSWMLNHRGAGRRKTEGPPSRRRQSRWGE